MKESLLAELKKKMGKTVEAVRSEFASIRTGRASPALLDSIYVDYYGAHSPLSAVANIGVPEPRLLVITPWEKKMVGEIEKAILKSDLGLTPVSDGKVIRLPIPSLTEERRKDLVKLVRKLTEEGRVSLRNIRREANEDIKKAEKSGELPEDDSHKLHLEIQKITDDYIKKLDELVQKKEEEVMEV